MTESIACMLASIAFERRRATLCQAHYEDWLEHRYERMALEAWLARHMIDDGIVYHRNVSALDRFWLDWRI